VGQCNFTRELLVYIWCIGAINICDRLYRITNFVLVMMSVMSYINLYSIIHFCNSLLTCYVFYSCSAGSLCSSFMLPFW